MTRKLVLLGLVAALAALATLPLSLTSARLAQSGLAANEAAGSVWGGTLRAAQAAGQSLGDVSVGLRPLPLLLGRRELDLSGAGWSARVVEGRRNGVLAGQGLLPSVAPTLVPGASLQVSLQQARLVFEDGHCIDAGGSVAALLQWQEDIALPELQLEGPVACAGGSGRITLATGASALVPVQLVVTVGGDGVYQLQATAQAADPASRAMLLLAGFQDTPSGLGRAVEGKLLR